MISENKRRTHFVLNWLVQQQCSEVVVCAGARNAPLVVALSSQTQFKVWSFFEERAAAFFALGRIQSTRQPVAVVTTSGTAAAELLPALIEADYTALPLLAVTADRPREYRGTGAPQAIEQVGLFSHYVEKSWDYSGEEEGLSWTKRRPFHLNVCLEESSRQELEDLARPLNLTPSPRHSLPRETQNQQIDRFQAQVQSPVVVVGIMNQVEAKLASDWLEKNQLPFYLECLANVTARSICESNRRVRGGEKALEWAFRKNIFDGVIRLGGIPTTRLWRDLESEYRNIPVISFGHPRFSGLARTSECRALEDLKTWSWVKSSPCFDSWNEIQEQAEAHLSALLEQFTLSEPAFLKRLGQSIPAAARLYIGNSLPIREWDRVVELKCQWQLSGNRGANGIDGQISTFLGFAEPDQSNWAVVGDLTALYDLAAPWVLSQRPLSELTVVVVNNGGGRIFSRLFSEPILENRHQMRFEKWAEMWKLDYELIADSRLVTSTTAHPRVVELCPDQDQTQQFNREWENFWTTKLI